MMRRLAAFLLLCSWVFPVFPAAKTGLEKWTRLPEHPRLLLLRGEEEAVHRAVTSNASWAGLHRAILSECDRILPLPPVKRIQTGRRLLDKSRECLRRVFYLSYAWRMTREARYLERAEKELLAVSAFSDWNPSHFLDVAEMTMAVSIGYDWLYGELSEPSRRILREAILRKGIEPSLDARHNGWLQASHNWNQVCNAGMTYGALAIFEERPELARQIIGRAIDSIALPAKDYFPDGAYPEGYGYWGYGTSFHVLFLSAVEKVFRQDFGLVRSSGFLKTAGYLENMTGPTGDCFNYSDSGSGSGLQPAMFWLAARSKDPSLLWVEKQHLAALDAEERRSNRLLPALLLWGVGMDLGKIREPGSRLWLGHGKNPVALMRTSWRDPGAIFVGVKGGSPSINHGHMDAGSFVMESGGVRWAMDFGAENYNTMETNGVNLWDRGQNSDRWQVFRYSNRVHNTLTVDDALQKVEGSAAITRVSRRSSFLNAVLDLSSVYRGLLASAQRGIGIADSRYVVVRDEVETAAAGKDTVVRWTMLTSAEVNLGGPGIAELSREGRRLRVEIVEPSGAAFRTWPTAPSRPFENPNRGTTLLGFEVRLPSATRSVLTVLLVPSEVDRGSVRKVPPLRQW